LEEIPLGPYLLRGYAFYGIKTMPWDIFNRLTSAVDWTFNRKQTVDTSRSTCLDYVEYTARWQYLYCGFTEGKEYRYSGDTKENFLDLVGAPSVGRHFNYNIRNNFPYTQRF
jgi:hypothetical protein